MGSFAVDRHSSSGQDTGRQIRTVAWIEFYSRRVKLPFVLLVRDGVVLGCHVVGVPR